MLNRLRRSLRFKYLGISRSLAVRFVLRRFRGLAAPLVYLTLGAILGSTLLGGSGAPLVRDLSFENGFSNLLALVLPVSEAQRGFSGDGVASGEPPAAGSAKPVLPSIVSSMFGVLAGGSLESPCEVLRSALPGFIEPVLVAASGPVSPENGNDALASEAGATDEWAQSGSGAGLPGELDATGPETGDQGEPDMDSVPVSTGTLVERTAPAAGQETEPVQSAVEEQVLPVASSTEPLVILYHTHSSETYHEPGMKLDDYNAHHKWNTEDTGIIRVGSEVARALRNEGIRTVHSTALHDSEMFSKAYINSLQTASRLLKENPSASAIIDIHRDGARNANFLTTVGGKEVAQVLIVVTTDRYGLPHPDWQKNLEFARRLNETMNRLYPGLSRGIRVVDDGRYNQHIHPRALLVEIGNYTHSVEPALRSAAMFAKALAVTLRSM